MTPPFHTGKAVPFSSPKVRPRHPPVLSKHNSKNSTPLNADGPPKIPHYHVTNTSFDYFPFYRSLFPSKNTVPFSFMN